MSVSPSYWVIHLIPKQDNYCLSVCNRGGNMFTSIIIVKECISHTKVYFNEYVANVMRDDIGIVFFDLHGGC